MDTTPGNQDSDSVIVAPTPMPWTDDDRLDRDALARNIEKWGRTSLSGFVVGSGGGEERFISEAEFFAAAEVVDAARPSGTLIIGGIDNPSSTETLRLGHALAERGADLLRVRIPQTAGGGNTGTVLAYFEEVVRRSPVPVVVIHQTWQTGGFAATPEEIGAICSLDNVHAYICWQNVRYEAFVRRFIPASVPVWAPNGTLLLPSAVAGIDGACAFFANWAPDLVRRIVDLGRSNQYAEARALQESIVWADYIGMAHGVAALKAGLSLLGFEGSQPRAPMAPLSPAVAEELEAAFRVAGLISD